MVSDVNYVKTKRKKILREKLLRNSCIKYFLFEMKINVFAIVQMFVNCALIYQSEYVLMFE